jgi:CRP-like cAMP-binding protein
VPAGTTLCREGDPADRAYVIERGRLEVASELPGGRRMPLASLGPGELLGETSLLGAGRRTGTVTSVEPTAGWTLGREAIDLLRLDSRPEAVEFVQRLGALAVQRLRARYENIAEQLGSEPYLVRSSRGARCMPDPAGLDYLSSLLCFARFSSREGVAAAVAGGRYLTAQPGDVLVAEGEQPTGLLLVVRGAVEVAVRRGRAAQRVRLAGPGRYVGHLGVLDDEPSPVTCRARERAILLELPSQQIAAALASGEPFARELTASLHTDVVRALSQAERPMARMVVAASA